MKLTSVLFLCALTLSACSDDSKTTTKKPDPSDVQIVEKAADCSFLEEDNCWKMAARTLNCHNSHYFTGKLSSTQDSCLLGDGTLVRMKSAENKQDLTVQIERLGRNCGTLHKTGHKVEITAKQFTASVERTDGAIKVTCGSETYSLSNALLQACDRFHIPGVQIHSATNDIMISLTGLGHTTAPLFRCVR